MHATDSVLGDFHIRATSAAVWSRTASTLATQIEEPWRSELQEEALSASTLAVNKGNQFLLANRQGKTVGMARGYRLPGRMALIRTVTLLKSEPDEIARQMIQTLDRQLMPEPDSFSTVSLRNPSKTQASWFESCGYARLSQVDTVGKIQLLLAKRS